MKEKKNLIWWQIILCYAAASVVVALLASMMSSLQGEQIMELIIGDIPAVLGNSFMLILWQKICKTRSSRTGIMLAVLTLSWMSYYGNGANAISIAIQLAISGTIYYFALLYGKTPREIEEEKNRNPEIDQQFHIEIKPEQKTEKKQTTQPINKVKIEKTAEVQENEALSIMQEAQLPKEEPEMGQINNQEVIPIKKDYKNHAIALFCLCCVLAFGLIYSTSMIDDKNDQIDELNNKLAARDKIVTKSMNVIRFFNEYCVIVYENDPGYYHKYRCSKDTSDGTFYMYNINAAVAYGLKPCSQCKDLEVSTIVARQSI